MKGRIFKDAKYKAWSQRIITSRVNPRNTSRECARCHGLVARYQEGQPEEGYTEGAPLPLEYGLRSVSQATDYAGVEEAAGFQPSRVSHTIKRCN